MVKENLGLRAVFVEEKSVFCAGEFEFEKLSGIAWRGHRLRPMVGAGGQ